MKSIFHLGKKAPIWFLFLPLSKDRYWMSSWISKYQRYLLKNYLSISFEKKNDSIQFPFIAKEIINSFHLKKKPPISVSFTSKGSEYQTPTIFITEITNLVYLGEKSSNLISTFFHLQMISIKCSTIAKIRRSFFKLESASLGSSRRPRKWKLASSRENESNRVLEVRIIFRELGAVFATTNE